MSIWPGTLNTAPDPGAPEADTVLSIARGWQKIAAQTYEDLKSTEARELELLQLTVKAFKKIANEPDPVKAKEHAAQMLLHFEATLQQYLDVEAPGV